MRTTQGYAVVLAEVGKSPVLAEVVCASCGIAYYAGHQCRRKG